MYRQFFQNMSLTTLLYVTCTLVFLLFVWHAFSAGKPTPDKSQLVSKSHDASSVLPGGKRSQAEPVNNEELVKFDIEEKRKQLDKELEIARKELTQTHELMATIVSRLDALQSNELGRKIANSEEHFSSVLMLTRFMPQKQKEVSDLAIRFESMVGRSARFTRGIEYDDGCNKVGLYSIDLQSLKKELTNISASIKAIEVVCLKNPATGITIREKIVQAEAAEANAWKVRVSEALESARESRSHLLLAAKQEKQDVELQIDDAKQKLKTVELSGEKTAILLKTDEIAAKQKHETVRAALEIEFQRDESKIRHYLAPFFAMGYSQPASGTVHAPTRKRGPVSMSALRSYGATVQSNGGLECLAFAINGGGNDRSRFSCPHYIGGHISADEDLYRYLITTQELLIKYQYLLVEKGMLAE